MKTYRLSAAGRRTTLVMLIAALLLWVFALWMLPMTLGLRVLDFGASLDSAITAGWSVSQLIEAAILVLIVVAAPLLMWTLWEEWNTSYTVDDDGLTYRTIQGVALFYPWTQVRDVHVRPADRAELIVADDGNAQIRSPLLRWLHRQGFGANTVPIYQGVEARDALIDEIVRRSGATNI